MPRFQSSPSLPIFVISPPRARTASTRKDGTQPLARRKSKNKSTRAPAHTAAEFAGHFVSLGNEPQQRGFTPRPTRHNDTCPNLATGRGVGGKRQAEGEKRQQPRIGFVRSGGGTRTAKSSARNPLFRQGKHYGAKDAPRHVTEAQGKPTHPLAFPVGKRKRATCRERRVVNTG